jgi:hypothetical protein
MLMRRQLLLLGLAASLGSSTAVSAQPDWVTQLLQAAQLPVVAAQARAEGMPNSDVSAVIEAVRRANLPSRDAASILDTGRVLRREHGPVDNFGAFVQSQLAAGKRGRDLSAAIRAEHARQGKGRGNANARGGQGRSNQNPGNASAKGNASGRSDAASRGQTGGTKRGADSAGRGATKGRGRGGPPTR